MFTVFRTTLSRRTTFRITLRATIVAVMTAGMPVIVAAQQSDLSVTPFVSFMPTTGASPLAGLALTLAGNSGLALRASGHLALEDRNNSNIINGGAMRPWGADADAVLFLGGGARTGYQRTIAPFVFAGVGVAGRDDGTTISSTSSATRSNWSYGAGLTVPLGSAIDLFGESRWRMSEFVLPTSHYAPSPTSELRVGLTFHIGGSSPESGRRRDRHSDAGFSMPSRLTLPARAPSSTTSSTSAARVIGTADDYVGVPYRYGGASPTVGFDCSGFTQFVFAKQGVRLPRTAREQAQVGTALPTDWSAVLPGDLVMFEENGRIGHVAIYAGQNRIIHSSSSGGGVRYDDLTTHRGEWFADHMVAARRVTADARGMVLDLARGFADGITLQLDGPDHAPIK